MFFITNWRLPYFEDASNMLVDVTFDWKRGWAIVNQKKIAFRLSENEIAEFLKLNGRNATIRKTYCSMDIISFLIIYYPKTLPRNRPELSTQKSFAWIIKQWIRLSYKVKIRIMLISEARSLALICKILHIILISLIQ